MQQSRDERVSVAEAARRLNVSTSTVRRRIASGELRSERDGRRLWVILEPKPQAEPLAPARSMEAPRAERSEAPATLPTNVTPFPARPSAPPAVASMWALRDRHTLEWLAAEWDGSQPRFTRALAGAAHFASASDARYTANALARDGRAVEVRMVFVEARAA